MMLNPENPKMSHQLDRSTLRMVTKEIGLRDIKNL